MKSLDVVGRDILLLHVIFSIVVYRLVRIFRKKFFLCVVMSRKSNVNALQSRASTSAQDKSGEDAGVYCDEVFIKAERDEDDDEVEFITEKDYFKEEDNFEEEECNYPGVCNEIQESEEEEEEQKYVGGTIGSAVKKEFEAVVTEVFLPPVKEELEEDFEPAGRDPLEDSPVRTIEDEVAESDVPVTSQECGGFPMNVLKFDEPENSFGKWKSDVKYSSFERYDKLQDDNLRKVLFRAVTDSSSFMNTYDQASNNDGILGPKSINVNSNMSDCNEIKREYGTVRNEVTDNARMSSVSSSSSHAMDAIKEVCANSKNDDLGEDAAYLSNSESMVFQNCAPALENNEGLMNPLGTQSCVVESGSAVAQNNTSVTKISSEECEETKLKWKYECNYCQKRFNSINTLRSHKRLHTGSKLLKCKWCGIAFYKREIFEDHVTLHIGETTYKCFLCAKEFLRDSDLANHMVIHNRAKVLKCDICSMSFDRNTELQQHALTHSKKDSFQCKICKKVFNNSDYLELHTFSHEAENADKSENSAEVRCDSVLTQNDTVAGNNEESEELKLKGKFGCKYCKKRYEKLNNCIFHERSHLGNRFTCKWCGMAFSRSDGLEDHKSVHAGDKAIYKCYLCGLEFVRDFVLTKHMVKHCGAKCHKCDLCGKGFYRRNDILRHMLAHSREKSFRCDVCEMVFADSHDLKIHMFSHKGLRPHECEICHKRFMQSENLKRHSVWDHN